MDEKPDPKDKRLVPLLDEKEWRQIYNVRRGNWDKKAANAGMGLFAIFAVCVLIVVYRTVKDW